MGAPYGQYLLDDVMDGRVHARLYVMLNAWRLSEQERTVLLDRLRGSTVIWCYAPGYFDGDRPSAGAMRQLTGLELIRCSGVKALATPTPAGKHSVSTSSSDLVSRSIRSSPSAGPGPSRSSLPIRMVQRR